MKKNCFLLCLYASLLCINTFAQDTNQSGSNTIGNQLSNLSTKQVVRSGYFDSIQQQGSYLGQQAPGNQPVLFAPGIVCTGMDERDITISPDGNLIVYGILEPPAYSLILIKKKNGIWGKQEIAPFSGRYNDFEPRFSPDGKRLYFCSERPLDEKGESKDSDIWYVDRFEDGWGTPVNIGPPVNTSYEEYYPSLTRDGTIYFTNHLNKICCSRLVNGQYTKPEVLSDSINTVAEYNAFIDPDERFLIYTSHGHGAAKRRGDLFIAYRRPDGSWSSPLNLGPEINSGSMDYCPAISPDGAYLFFSSNRVIIDTLNLPVTTYEQLRESSNQPGNKKNDIYWVSAEFIEKLCPKETE